MQFMVEQATTLAVPVIGISGGNSDSASVRAMMTQIETSGAIPLFLGNHANRDAQADIGKIDALIVMGNDADIDPAKYGAAPHPHTRNENNTPEGKARAEYEEALMRRALDMGMPLLGVCGGMQRLNVICGGSLHQHVPDMIGHDEHAQQHYRIAPFIPVQPVLIAQDSALASIAAEISTIFAPGHAPAPPGVIMENSMHHQAVYKVGNGLRVAATAEDTLQDGSKLTEAIEADPNGPFGKQFLLGVQWHPEFSASPLGARIAHRIASAAREFAQAHGREHTWEDVQKENIMSASTQVQQPASIGGAPPVVRPGSMTEMILRQRAARNLSGDASLDIAI